MGWDEGGHWPSEIWRWEEITGGRLLSRGRDGRRDLLRTSVLVTLWGKGLNHLRNDGVSLLCYSRGREGFRVCGSRVIQGPRESHLLLWVINTGYGIWGIALKGFHPSWRVLFLPLCFSVPLASQGGFVRCR